MQVASENEAQKDADNKDADKANAMPDEVPDIRTSAVPQEVPDTNDQCCSWKLHWNRSGQQWRAYEGAWQRFARHVWQGKLL